MSCVGLTLAGRGIAVAFQSRTKSPTVSSPGFACRRLGSRRWICNEISSRSFEGNRYSRAISRRRTHALIVGIELDGETRLDAVGVGE